jgi:hypothetical protein
MALSRLYPLDCLPICGYFDPVSTKHGPHVHNPLLLLIQDQTQGLYRLSYLENVGRRPFVHLPILSYGLMNFLMLITVVNFQRDTSKTRPEELFQRNRFRCGP